MCALSRRRASVRGGLSYFLNIWMNALKPLMFLPADTAFQLSRAALPMFLYASASRENAVGTALPRGGE